MMSFSEIPSASAVSLLILSAISIPSALQVLAFPLLHTIAWAKPSAMCFWVTNMGAPLTRFVVYTAAVHDDNPEIIYAKENNIPLLSRAEFLGAIMKTYKHACGISGTHGKTTTCGMLASVFDCANLKPTVHVGGIINQFNSNFFKISKFR